MKGRIARASSRSTSASECPDGRRSLGCGGTKIKDVGRSTTARAANPKRYRSPTCVPFTVELTGEAEVTSAGVPNQGDLDGSGTATVTVNPGQREVCWSIEVTDVAPITMAHIHSAVATTTGPVVVPLNPYEGGCTKVSRELALDIVLHPSSYYVNVHNTEFPAGALRGQLDR